MCFWEYMIMVRAILYGNTDTTNLSPYVQNIEKKENNMMEIWVSI